MRLLAIIVALVASNTYASSPITLKSDTPACLSEDDYDQMLAARSANNESWLTQIFASNRCQILKKDTKGALKDVQIFGPNEVYVLPPRGGQPVVLWMNIDSEDIDD